MISPINSSNYLNSLITQPSQSKSVNNTGTGANDFADLLLSQLSSQAGTGATGTTSSTQSANNGTANPANAAQASSTQPSKEQQILAMLREIVSELGIKHHHHHHHGGAKGAESATNTQTQGSTSTNPIATNTQGSTTSNTVALNIVNSIQGAAGGQLNSLV